jgi:hypothetical protein
MKLSASVIAIIVEGECYNTFQGKKIATQGYIFSHNTEIEKNPSFESLIGSYYCSEQS